MPHKLEIHFIPNMFSFLKQKVLGGRFLPETRLVTSLENFRTQDFWFLALCSLWEN